MTCVRSWRGSSESTDPPNSCATGRLGPVRLIQGHEPEDAGVPDLPAATGPCVILPRLATQPLERALGFLDIQL